MLEKTTSGIGLLALAGLMDQEARGDASPIASVANPLAVRSAALRAKAKRVIFLFMSGGPSHVDLFDPKPRVARNGKPLPFEMPKLVRTKTGNLLASPFKFEKHGQSGIEVSELLPNIGSLRRRLCVIRSMVADNINHNGACLQMNTGEQAFSRPSMGSWLLYGLGTENQNLPGFVVISPSQPAQGRRCGARVFCRRLIKERWFRTSSSRSPICQWPSSTSPTSAQQLDAGQAAERAAPRGRAEDSRWPPGSSRSNWRFACRCKPPRRLTSSAKAKPRTSCTASATRSPTSSAGNA